MSLTESEKTLAAEVGFDEKALAIVKELTHSPFKKWALNAFELEDSQLQYMKAPLQSTEERIAQLRKIESDYPELSKLIEKHIENAQRQGEVHERMTGGSDPRSVMKKLAPYWPYMRQEAASRNQEEDSFFPEISGYNASNIDSVIESLKHKYANTQLLDKYKPYPVVEFNLPSDNPNQAVRDLQGKLTPLKYTVYATDESTERVTLFGEEALAARKTAGPVAGQFSFGNLPYDTIVDFDPAVDDASSVMRFVIPVGATVEKISAKKWKVHSPASFSINRTTVKAVLAKSDLDGINFVRCMGSCGPNYDVSPEMVVSKLQKWDKDFGIRVLRARADLVEFDICSVPKDVDYFLTESWLFCPDMRDMRPGDYVGYATEMRTAAQKLENDHRVQLWWD